MKFGHESILSKASITYNAFRYQIDGTKFTKIIGEASESDFVGHDVHNRILAEADVELGPGSRLGSGDSQARSEPVSIEERKWFGKVQLK